MYCYSCMTEFNDGRYCPACGCDNKREIGAHHLKPGQLLNGRYNVGYVIGEGGFGITYVGKDMVLDLKVAIKEYFPVGYVNRYSDATNEVTITSEKQIPIFEKGKDRFLQEAQSLAKFSREKGIVDVRDYFEQNGTAYIIMEYLDGENLMDYIRHNGVMKPDYIFRLMYPIMQSLRVINDKGITHRDISPDNIMFLKDGTLKLMDFGSARYYTNEEKEMSVMLKRGYAPEEQYRKNGRQGPWTDVYGLCATIYRCITGVLPEDALDRVVDDTLKKPSELSIDISKSLEDVLMYGLAVQSSNRIQDMGQLMSLLDQALANKVVDVPQHKSSNAVVISTGGIFTDNSTAEQMTEYADEVVELANDYNHTVAADDLEIEILSENNNSPGFNKPDNSYNYQNNQQQNNYQYSNQQYNNQRYNDSYSDSYNRMSENSVSPYSGYKSSTSENFTPKKKQNHLWLWLLLGAVLIALIVVFVVLLTKVMDTTDNSTDTNITYEEDNIELTGYIMENYVGSKFDDVKPQLEDIGLVVEVVEVYNDVYDEGYIIEHTPEAGTTVYEGDSILISVSLGSGESPYEYSQLITVTASSGSSNATLKLLDWQDGGWKETFSCSAKVGKQGISSNYGENIAATPLGLFELGSVLTPRSITDNMDEYYVNSSTCIVDDPSSPLYNQIILDKSTLPSGTHYDLIGEDLTNGNCNALIFIKHNGGGFSSEGVVTGKGSAITICGMNGTLSATYGCIDISASDMTTLLSKLDASKNPYIETKVK